MSNSQYFTDGKSYIRASYVGYESIFDSKVFLVEILKFKHEILVYSRKFILDSDHTFTNLHCSHPIFGYKAVSESFEEEMVEVLSRLSAELGLKLKHAPLGDANSLCSVFDRKYLEAVQQEAWDTRHNSFW